MEYVGRRLERGICFGFDEGRLARQRRNDDLAAQMANGRAVTHVMTSGIRSLRRRDMVRRRGRLGLVVRLLHCTDRRFRLTRERHYGGRHAV